MKSPVLKGDKVSETPVRKSKDQKLYKCLCCGKVSERKDWNDIAEDFYGCDVVSVAHVCGDRRLYTVCPKCKTELYGDLIEKV